MSLDLAVVVLVYFLRGMQTNHGSHLLLLFPRRDQVSPLS